MSTLLIMAGGTGGHVYPALAIADFLRAQGVRIVWMGTRQGMESRVVPKAGYEMEWVKIKGLHGTGILRWLFVPFLLSYALLQTVGIILRQRPDALLGMGGFVAGPGGLVAWLLRRPLIIHEQNSIAGWTNRLLAHLADKVLAGFSGTFREKLNPIYVGNPVRADIANLPIPEQRYANRKGPIRILVIGGSQGARVFNDNLPSLISVLPQHLRPVIWHQCGRGNEQVTEEKYAQFEVPAKVEEFIEDMARAYAWADLVVSRAGAMTIAELTVAGVAAVLVPYPHATNDHQTANAMYMSENDAAFLLPQQALNDRSILDIFQKLEVQAQGRSRILKMANSARSLGRSDAVNVVAEQCMEAIRA
ncbi:undecaprenyldiphospho-muramoylpentapeptide beta-N-acetylglucosaminyltransferase [Pseudomonadota bacterium]